MADIHQLHPVETLFGLAAAGRLMTEAVPAWVQDLGLLVESIESGRPAGAGDDWQPGAIVRMPFSQSFCRDGVVSAQALMALADTAMLFACAAAWNGYRPIRTIDQTTHFLRPANVDVIADARVMRIGDGTSFGRFTLFAAADRRPVGMGSGAYAMA
jgi:acyl-coenzyme A thioesterase PaaI-like protein